MRYRITVEVEVNAPNAGTAQSMVAALGKVVLVEPLAEPESEALPGGPVPAKPQPIRKFY